eukprot:Platyproteum_vivax@DN11252_c0_g1_i1.p1
MALKFYCGYGLMAACCILLPIIALIQTQTTLGFYLSMVILFFLGATTGATQVTTQGLAAAMHPDFISALMQGQGVAGIACLFLKLFFTFWTPRNASSTVVTYFVVLYFVAATIIVSSSLLTYHHISNLHMVKEAILQ